MLSCDLVCFMNLRVDIQKGGIFYNVRKKVGSLFFKVFSGMFRVNIVDFLYSF